MNNIVNIIFVVLGIIIVGCLLLGCRYKMEGLEDMKLTDTSYCGPMDENTCNTDPKCQWQSTEGEAGMCMPNVLTESNVPMQGPDVLPSMPEGYSNYY